MLPEYAGGCIFIKKFLDKWTPKLVSEGDCIRWGGGFTGQGYGNVGVGVSLRLSLGVANKYLCAHKIFYLIFNGPVPDGLLVRHSCDHPWCVNPQHLSIGTYNDNYDDMRLRGRMANHLATNAKGEAHYNVKISDADVEEIKRRLAAGEPRSPLAAEFGISKSYMAKLAIGRARCGKANEYKSKYKVRWVPPEERAVTA